MLLLQLQVRLALEHRVVLVLQLSRVVEEEAFHLRLAEEALEGVLVQREAVLPPVALPSEAGGPGCLGAGAGWLKLGEGLPPATSVWHVVKVSSEGLLELARIR
jgi:hypothetical protein